MLSVFATNCQQTAVHRLGLARSSRGREIARVVEDGPKLRPRRRKASSGKEVCRTKRYCLNTRLCGRISIPEPPN